MVFIIFYCFKKGKNITFDLHVILLALWANLDLRRVKNLRMKKDTHMYTLYGEEGVQMEPSRLYFENLEEKQYIRSSHVLQEKKTEHVMKIIKYRSKLVQNLFVNTETGACVLDTYQL